MTPSAGRANRTWRRKRARAVGPDCVELFFCRLQQHDRGLAVLAALVGEPDGGMHRFQLGGEGSLLVVGLHGPAALALEHDELSKRHLVEPTEKPNQQDDGDRDPDQPEQKTFTHCVLLFRLAHINVRWELRFHVTKRAGAGKKQGLCERGRVRVRPRASPVGNISAATISSFDCRTRIERERRSAKCLLLIGAGACL